MKYASIGIYVCDMFIRKIIYAVIINQFQGLGFRLSALACTTL